MTISQKGFAKQSQHTLRNGIPAFFGSSKVIEGQWNASDPNMPMTWIEKILISILISSSLNFDEQSIYSNSNPKLHARIKQEFENLFLEICTIVLYFCIHSVQYLEEFRFIHRTIILLNWFCWLPKMHQSLLKLKLVYDTRRTDTQKFQCTVYKSIFLS